MEFYDILVFIHIISAIVGMGPGFLMMMPVKTATTMTELRYGFRIRAKLHWLVMIGGTLLLVTGLAMGALRPFLFSQGWFVTSLLLFLLALAFGPLVLSPRSKPIKSLLQIHHEDTIPDEYFIWSKKLFFYERIESLLFFLIIILMITKPF
ncbi:MULTISPECIES: DUF2269 family protein [Clostridia]|uniref:DUF2269 family protein n=1 Tax=Clostridia TaxID=186801 RepID=UPI000EA0EEBA|nr:MULTISPECIES: DUF2269 family protein [Clostridia]NBJ71690.1 DUF2269 family protein [Roseburia sp. 1XD42-34]RKI73784.1 DUF2269 family protein [Clostridium sp. 1xD42-85]